jgi:hypothetical protein
MKVVVAAFVTIAVLAGPALAQPSKYRKEDPRAEMKREFKAARDRAEIEKEYNETMKRTRSTGPAPKSDPWSGVRSNSNGDAKR